MTEKDTGRQEGRPEQRRRTRKAIVDAAMGVMKRGVAPSVGDIAEAANVSRRTVYMHFPSLEQLLLDATLGSLAHEAIEPALQPSKTPADVEESIERLARAVTHNAAQTLPMGRKLMRLTAELPATEETPARGYRRVQWIETAIAPLRSGLSPSQFKRLVSALSVLLGWEALIVLRDIRGLGRRQEEDVIVWAARALVKAALEESNDSKKH